MKRPRKALIADLALFSVAIFWGFNFVVIKNVTERLTHTVAAYGQGVVAATMLYLFFRYIVATLIFSGIQPHALLRATRRQWGMGGLLGGFYLTALVVQTIGLQYTTPGKSGFITGLSVAMVPFLYWAVARRSPGWFQALGAIVATAGLGILSLRGNLTVSWGDALTLLGALLYALHIMTTGFFAPKVPPSTLAVTQMAVSTVLLVAITPFVAHLTLALGWQAWVEILWTALSGTIYAFFIQSWAQRYTTSTHAAGAALLRERVRRRLGRHLRHGHGHAAHDQRRLADLHRHHDHRAVAGRRQRKRGAGRGSAADPGR